MIYIAYSDKRLETTGMPPCGTSLINKLLFVHIRKNTVQLWNGEDGYGEKPLDVLNETKASHLGI